MPCFSICIFIHIFSGWTLFGPYQRVIIAFPFTLERTETLLVRGQRVYYFVLYFYARLSLCCDGQKAVSTSKKVRFGNRFYTLDFR